MYVRQILYLQPARAIAYKDPVPVGRSRRRSPDQFLIDQPRLYRAEVAEARARNTLHCLRHFERAVPTRDQ